MSGGAANVIVDDVHLQNVGQGLRIKARTLFQVQMKNSFIGTGSLRKLGQRAL